VLTFDQLTRLATVFEAQWGRTGGVALDGQERDPRRLGASA
jgi:hypothetical protein